MAILSRSSNSFRGQLSDEVTVLATRKHWITIVAPMALVLFVSLIPGLIYRFLLLPANWYSSQYDLLFRFISGAYFLVVWNIAFYNLMIYFLNTLIITDRRIVENKQLGFFNNIINEIKIDKVQDVSVKIKGPLATFLKYGDIEIQSAGAVNKFFFRQFPDPEKIKQIISGSVKIG